jgi:hypothetical protein
MEASNVTVVSKILWNLRKLINIMRVCQVLLFLCSGQDCVTKEFRKIEARYAFGLTKEWMHSFWRKILWLKITLTMRH